MSLKREFVIVAFLLTGLLIYTYHEKEPVKRLMNWRASMNARAEKEVSPSTNILLDYTLGDESTLTVDFAKGKHFWYPQIAIWLEDSAGSYIETLFVTTSTARGLFYPGRSSESFRESDEAKSEEHSSTRRVDALPYWSHKRDHQYDDGFYSPPPDEPLPDAITGATPKDNFYFMSAPVSLTDWKSFSVRVEINVAFDENEYYSEYDFSEDTLYHGGTGLLGQPSVVYGVSIKKTDSGRYYVLDLLGHGHHSGSTGELLQEIRTLSTAKYIVERIVVGVGESWYSNQR